MKIGQSVKIAASLLKARFSACRAPVLVGWAVTKRCNSRCVYCNAWQHSDKSDLSTEEMINILKDLVRLNTRCISFTGGEPLLRDDLNVLIDICKANNIYTQIGTNGILLKDRIDVLKNIDSVVISYDGSREVHDFTRGKNSHKTVIDTMRLIKDFRKRLVLSVTVSKYNIKEIDHILDAAKRYNAGAVFQPVWEYILYTNKQNPHVPEKKEFADTFKYILKKKTRSPKRVKNSFASIKYFIDLFEGRYVKPVKCVSGKITCRIQADGRVCLCNRFDHKDMFSEKITAGKISDEFFSLPKQTCDPCICINRLNLNLLFNHNMLF